MKYGLFCQYWQTPVKIAYQVICLNYQLPPHTWGTLPGGPVLYEHGSEHWTDYVEYPQDWNASHSHSDTAGKKKKISMCHRRIYWLKRWATKLETIKYKIVSIEKILKLPPIVSVPWWHNLLPVHINTKLLYLLDSAMFPRKCDRATAE